MAASKSKRRIQKELERFTPNEYIDIHMDEKDYTLLHANMKGADGTLYAGEMFKLRIRIPTTYPFSPPEVVFLPSACPVHGHVYSIDWSPALTIQSVLLSILSMLSSASFKKRPSDDQMYTNRGVKYPSDVQWDYHDEKA